MVLVLLLNVINIIVSVSRRKPNTDQVILGPWLSKNILMMMCTHLKQDHRP